MNASSEATEVADIDYLLEKLGHGAGTTAERALVKKFRTQVIIAGMMDAMRAHQLGAPARPSRRARK